MKIDTIEGIVVSGLILMPGKAMDIVPTMRNVTFSDVRLELVFAAIAGIVADDRQPNATEVIERLRQNGTYEAVGRESFVAALLATATNVYRLDEYVEYLRNHKST
jgi:replicative DNA helicase